jgi:hypothetical protein
MQADGAAGSGFDVMVTKQKQGKDDLKEIAEWMRERCVDWGWGWGGWVRGRGLCD